MVAVHSCIACQEHSGFRLVRVEEDVVHHNWYSLAAMPTVVGAETVPAKAGVGRPPQSRL